MTMAKKTARNGSAKSMGAAAKKTSKQLNAEIASSLAGRTAHASIHASMKYDRDDARAYGVYAYRMEQTKAEALANAKAEGFAAHQLGAVEDGWDAERRDTIHGGFTGSSHATKKKPAITKKREIQELQDGRDRVFQALGYAGNTAEQVRRYHAMIDEINAKLGQLK
jgi:hypothetical protein